MMADDASADNQQDSLLTKPWHACNSSVSYFVKYEVTDCSYCVLFTDMRNVFFECLTDRDQEMTTRCQELNPTLEMSTKQILEKVKSMLSRMVQTNVWHAMSGHIEVDDSSSTCLRIKSSLPLAKNWSFQWMFDARLESKEMYWKHVTQPLFGIVSSLLKQKKELIEIVKKKDAEIEDYKLGGAVVSRKYIETAPFSVEAFSKSYTENENVGKTSLQPHGTIISEGEGAELYQFVTGVLNSQKNNNTSDTTVVSSTAETVVPNGEISSDHNVASPTKQKEELHDTQEMEFVKRKELEKITSTAANNKKKKRKIKL